MSCLFHIPRTEPWADHAMEMELPTLVSRDIMGEREDTGTDQRPVQGVGSNENRILIKFG